MNRKKSLWSLIDHAEEFLYTVLLVGFISLLFAQIIGN